MLRLITIIALAGESGVVVTVEWICEALEGCLLPFTPNLLWRKILSRVVSCLPFFFVFSSIATPKTHTPKSIFGKDDFMTDFPKPPRKKGAHNTRSQVDILADSKTMLLLLLAIIYDSGLIREMNLSLCFSFLSYFRFFSACREKERGKAKNNKYRRGSFYVECCCRWRTTSSTTKNAKKAPHAQWRGAKNTFSPRPPPPHRRSLHSIPKSQQPAPSNGPKRNHTQPSVRWT